MDTTPPWCSSAAVFFSAALGLACGTAGPDPKVCPRIVNGAVEPDLFALDSWQRSAIVAIYPRHRETICTGVFVTPGVVLSAAHCVDPEALMTLAVGSWDSPADAMTPRRAMLHPQLDVAVLWVDPAARAGSGFIPPYDGSMDEGWLDRSVMLAGVGRTEQGQVGELRFVGEPIVDLLPAAFVVDGEGHRGACGGDSGGPALARDASGRVVVLGLLDTGDPSCLDQDVYTRADALAAWWPFDWSYEGGDPDLRDACASDGGLLP